MKQTAVEWLREKLWKEFNFSFSDNILEQAKEMHKQEIIDAYWTSYKEGQYSGDKTADEYYNETFKNTEQ